MLLCFLDLLNRHYRRILMKRSTELEKLHIKPQLFFVPSLNQSSIIYLLFLFSSELINKC